MNQQEIKKHIQKWIKTEGKLSTHFGEVVLDKQLGEGGTALVYASKFASGTAVKFLAESVSNSQSTRYKRFLNEYVNLVKLVPTGTVVPLYYFGVQNMGDNVHIPYIIMEHCVKTLQTEYKDNKLNDAAEFKRLLNRLLENLEIIHNTDIVHRDIKPQNILLRPNGDWVLADFGIAWFDPETYQKTAQTKKGDRMANFEFSPPEQRRRDAYEKAEPNMDLFALGQTLYYCVTGETIRAIGHSRLRQVAPSLESYDPLIEKLVQQNPSQRFQSVSEIRGFLENQKGETVVNREESLFRSMYRQTEEFDKCLRRAMPGSHRHVQAKDKNEINRVLTSLADGCDECDLYRSDSEGESEACPMRELSEGIWLIGSHECDVIDLWIYRHPTLERQYVLIHLASRPMFDVYDFDYSDMNRVEAGYFDGRYVTRSEYDDRYAIIDGQSVELMDVELRIRNLREDFLVLATRLSVYKSNTIREVCNSLRVAGKIDPSLLAPLQRIRRAEWMSMYD